MVPFNLSKRAVSPTALAIAAGIGRRQSCTCADARRCACNRGVPSIYRPGVSLGSGLGSLSSLGSLGLSLPGSVSDVYQAGRTGTGPVGSVLDSVSMGLNFVPGVGSIASSTLSIFRAAIGAFEGWLGIGKGSAEADIIVPAQNQLMDRLGAITDQILVSRAPGLSVLASLYLEVWQLALGFMEFVLDLEFTDRRASGQALNTVMPYIDGTCGYSEPLGLEAFPGQRNCLTWGDGTLGGPGEDGMLGAIGRAIEIMGGVVPDLGSLSQQAGTGVDPGTITLPPVSTVYNALRSNVPLLLGGLLLVGLSGSKLFKRPR